MKKNLLLVFTFGVLLLGACASTPTEQETKQESGNDFDAELAAAKQAARRSLLKDSFDYGSLADLHYAAGWGSQALVSYILQRDPKIDVRDKIDRTPLFLAAGFNRKNVVQFLLSEGAEAEAQNSFGTRPLHMAAGFNSDLGVLEVLLSAWVDVQSPNKFGSTPLHWSAGAAALEQTKLLVESGANNVKAKDKQGRRPVDVIESRVLKNKTAEERKAVRQYFQSLP